MMTSCDLMKNFVLIMVAMLTRLKNTNRRHLSVAWTAGTCMVSNFGFVARRLKIDVHLAPSYMKKLLHHGEQIGKRRHF